MALRYIGMVFLRVKWGMVLWFQVPNEVPVWHTVPYHAVPVQPCFKQQNASA